MQERKCSGCSYTESRPVAKTGHTYNALNICQTCWYVNLDENAAFVELGVICDNWYGSGATANYAWDVKLWNGKLYRGAGDYDKNSGATKILAYDLTTQTWEISGTANDEAIHGFEEIGGTLYAPGIDPLGGHTLGNFYVLEEDGGWKMVRNLPNGIHCFDMAECNGKIFAGLGTGKTANTVAVSEDGGKSFQIVPLYKDGAPMDVSSYKLSRTHEFIKYKDDIYALVYFHMGFGGGFSLFRYDDGKMVYVENGYMLAFGSGVSRKYIGGNVEFNGTCYVTASGLYAITDFSDMNNYQKIDMPNKETVVDALVKDGALYVLATSSNRNAGTQTTESYKTVIYKSTTGQKGSFEEVLQFDYSSFPLSFDWDGTYFYIGTGTSVVKAKTGMILRVKAAA